jgi:hypothetical protein
MTIKGLRATAGNNLQTNADCLSAKINCRSTAAICLSTNGNILSTNIVCLSTIDICRPILSVFCTKPGLLNKKARPKN